MDELRECPFCGGSKLHIGINARHPNLFPYAAHVLCLNCLASVGSHGFEQTEAEAQAKAVTAWNRRHTPKPEALTCEGCAHKGTRHQKCTCCKRSVSLKDCYTTKPETEGD